MTNMKERQASDVATPGKLLAATYTPEELIRIINKVATPVPKLTLAALPRVIVDQQINIYAMGAEGMVKIEQNGDVFLYEYATKGEREVLSRDEAIERIHEYRKLHGAPVYAMGNELPEVPALWSPFLSYEDPVLWSPIFLREDIEGYIKRQTVQGIEYDATRKGEVIDLYLFFKSIKPAVTRNEAAEAIAKHKVMNYATVRKYLQGQK